MADFTPGPWILDEFNVLAGEGAAAIASVFQADDFPCLDDEGDERAVVQLECEANARLIVAAPDLLAACVKSLEMYRPGDTDSPLQAQLRAVIHRAQVGG